MAQIGVSFTPNAGSPVYNIVFDNFGGNEMPRTYQQGSELTRSATGSNILTGPAFRQKYMWAMSSIVPTAEAETFDVMFQAWDSDRAAGYPVAVGVTDTTFGATVSTSAVISTAPNYVRLSPTHTLVSFGMMEV
jgi:hypothetical protein